MKCVGYSAFRTVLLFKMYSNRSWTSFSLRFIVLSAQMWELKKEQEKLHLPEETKWKTLGGLLSDVYCSLACLISTSIPTIESERVLSVSALSSSVHTQNQHENSHYMSMNTVRSKDMSKGGMPLIHMCTELLQERRGAQVVDSNTLLPPMACFFRSRCFQTQMGRDVTVSVDPLLVPKRCSTETCHAMRKPQLISLCCELIGDSWASSYPSCWSSVCPTNHTQAEQSPAVCNFCQKWDRHVQSDRFGSMMAALVTEVCFWSLFKRPLLLNLTCGFYPCLLPRD